MRPYLRHILIGFLIVAPFVVVIAATIGARSAVPRLLSQEVDQGAASMPAFVEREYHAKKPLPEPVEVEKRCWQQAAASMQGDGASEIEAQEIAAALQARFHRTGQYAMPIHLRGESIWGRRVWAITFAWEYQREADRDRTPPCHRWTVVIEAAHPHHVLAESRCE